MPFIGERAIEFERLIVEGVRAGGGQARRIGLGGDGTARTACGGVSTSFVVDAGSGGVYETDAGHGGHGRCAVVAREQGGVVLRNKRMLTKNVITRIMKINSPQCLLGPGCS